MVFRLWAGEQQDFSQFRGHRRIIEFGCSRSGNDDDIFGGQQAFVAAEEFPDEAFDPIPLYRFSQALGHNNP